MKHLFQVVGVVVGEDGLHLCPFFLELPVICGNVLKSAFFYVEDELQFILE